MTREELLKVAKPILFNTEMVRATLEGRKTCTRRVIKPQAKKIYWNPASYPNGWTDEHGYQRKEPYQTGDILYVRETWQHNPIPTGWPYDYKASPEYNSIEHEKWKPSIHMPKTAARIFLKVTDVRVERLQDMSIQDMINEGVKASDITTNRGVIEYRVVNRFEELWDSTVKKKDLDKYGFGANPWVWVIEYEMVN